MVATGAKVLVVGPRADWDFVRQSAISYDCVYYSTLEAAWRVRGTPVDAEHVIDVTRHTLEYEERAWNRTLALHEALQESTPLQSRDLLESMRRRTLIQLMVPIAKAQAYAVEVASRVGSAQVSCVGLGYLEVLALKHQYPELEQPYGATPRNNTDPRSGSRLSRALGLVGSTLRALWDSLWRPLELRRLKHNVSAARAQGPRDRVAIVVAALDQQVKFLESTLDELNSRGWRTMIALSLSRGEPSPDTVSRFDASIRLTDLFDRRPIVALVRRRLARPRVAAVVGSWCAANDIGDYANWLTEGLLDAYYLRIAEVTKGYSRLFRWIRPSLALTVSETGVPEMVVPVARSRRVPTVNVQHGVITETPMRADFRFDAFCVFGEAYADNLIASGTDKDRVHVVGNPVFDLERGAVVTESSLPDQARPSGSLRLMFAAQHSRDYMSDYSLYASLKPLLQYLETDTSIELIIKWHPYGEGWELGYQVALAEHPNVQFSGVRDRALFDVVASSDVVCAYSSTVVFDALSVRKPVIVVSPRDVDTGRAMFAEATGLVARSSTELGECIERVRAGYRVSESDWERLNYRYTYKRDGLAGVRIADICEDLVAHMERENPVSNGGSHEYQA